MLHAACWLALALSSQASSVAVHPPSRGDQTDPTAVLTEQGLVVAWVDRRATASEVMYAHSPDLTTFSAPYSLSGKRGVEIIRPSAAALGARVVVAWSDVSLGDYDVYAVSSEDGGRTFAPPILVAGGPGAQLDPRATFLEDGRAAIVFHDNFGSSSDWRVRVVTSDVAGHFGAAVLAGEGRFSAIAAADTSTIAVAFIGEGVRVAQSIDGGASFEPPQRIDPPIGSKLYPRIAWGSSGWFACFASLLPAADQRGSLIVEDEEYLDVILARAGESVTANDTRALTQHACDVAARGDRAAIVWIDHSKPNERRVMIKRSGDGGASFGAETAVSETGEVFHPAVAIDATTTVVVFEAATGGTWDVRATILRD